MGSTQRNLTTEHTETTEKTKKIVKFERIGEIRGYFFNIMGNIL
jgi:hypothetical protein